MSSFLRADKDNRIWLNFRADEREAAHGLFAFIKWSRDPLCIAAGEAGRSLG
jgi:hypothetical protein